MRENQTVIASNERFNKRSNMPSPLLRALVDTHEKQIQKARIQFGNRLAALERGSDDSADTMQKHMVKRWHETFLELEKLLNKDIAEAVEEEPIHEHMVRVKGIGPLLSAKIISMVDIEKANTVSALWRYSGYGMGDYWVDEDGKVKAPARGWQWKGEVGKKQKVLVVAESKPNWKLVRMRDRMVAGWCSPYNKRLKTTLHTVATSFMKCGSPYTLVYYWSRTYYEEVHPEWTKAHVHAASLRKVVKVFLSHLWVRWRELEGLPIRELYVIEKLGHTHKYEANEFGWGELEESE